MDYLPIAIGQAGNQINFELSKMLLQDSQDSDNIFTVNNNMIKSFVIDSEIKVLKKYLSDENLKKYYIQDKNLIKNSSGRGNNWAFGYDIEFKEFKQEKSLVQDAFEKLESFIEKCDFLNGFIFIHSLYGGTGSGVSTRLIEMLSDHYGKFNILDVPVSGMNVEKTTLSYYNKFFTIGHIYDKVDSILLIDNEKLKKLCETTNIENNPNNQNKTRYSFENFNINCAKIIHNFIKYSKDFKHDFYFQKYNQNMKFVDLSFCEFDHVVNEFDFRKHCRNNLFLEDEFEQDNFILSADYILENNTNNINVFRKDEYVNKINSVYTPILSNSIYKNNKIIKNNRTQLTTFLKNFHHKKILENDLEIVEERVRSRYKFSFLLNIFLYINFLNLLFSLQFSSIN